MTTKRQISTIEQPGNSPIMAWIRDHLTYPHDYCLIWPFARARQGYGSFGRADKYIYAHRYICELVHGAPPDGYQAAHSCGRGHEGCVNPRHLSWKSPADNQLDRVPRIGRTKLNAAQALEIRNLKGREHVTETALWFGVTEANVRQIQSGKIWRDGSKWTSLPDDTVRTIRTSGARSAELAKRFGVHPSTIERIKKRQSYGHVPDAAEAA